MRGEITSEKDVKARIKKLLDKHGWFWWMPAANGFGGSGVSDFCALKSGVFLAIEAKFGKNKPTVMQVGYLNSVRAESGFAFVVSEKTLHALEYWLDAFERSVKAYAGGQRETIEDGAGMLDAIRLLTEPL